MVKKKVNGNKVNRARDQAVQLVYEVTENGAYANLALNKALRHLQLSGADRSLLTELVNGTIRMIKHLDWVLNLFLRAPIDKQNPWMRSILRVSTYQIMFMDRIPDFACVNDAVEISHRRCNNNLSRVVNGVLRNLIRHKDNIKYPPANSAQFLAVYYSHPQELVDYLLKHFTTEATREILVYNNRPARLDLRVNRLKTDSDLLVASLTAEGVKCRISPVIPFSIRVENMGKPLEELFAYKEGLFYVQNEASMLAAIILNLQSGEVVFDLCCGVGGKTTHIAEVMGNQGLIKAYDIYSQKIDILQENCARLGIDIVKEEVRDIMKLNETTRAKRVLLDAPCSGTGVLNRRSDARWNKDINKIQQLSELQYELLQKAGHLVESGGYLLYSTCSILREENEEIIQAFLEHSDFQLQGFNQEISFFPLDDEDRERASQGMLTLLPGKYDTDGMFFALMKNISKTDTDKL